MSEDERRGRRRGSDEDEIYRRAVTGVGVPVRGARDQNAPAPVTRNPDAAALRRRRTTATRGDLPGETELPTTRRSRVKRPAGGRRPEEGGSPRGMRGAKRGAAALGARLGVGGPLPPDAVPGAAYQSGGGTDRKPEHGGA